LPSSALIRRKLRVCPDVLDAFYPNPRSRVNRRRTGRILPPAGRDILLEIGNYYPDPDPDPR